MLRARCGIHAFIRPFHAGRAAMRPGNQWRGLAHVQSSEEGESSEEGDDMGLRRVAIVGTGPAGFYTAKYLLKGHRSVQVDLFDSLPTPFGLVRSGVAPDHPEVKSVQEDFTQVATSMRVKFLGNVSVGEDISLPQLARHYDAVVLAYGAKEDRELGVEGETLHGVYSARQFVNWYNGHPDHAKLGPDLSTESAVIVGQGNVALDCARILSKDAEELAHTDITTRALDLLRRSRVRTVTVAGRRGHVQGAFAIKELRECTRLDNARFAVRAAELDKGLTPASREEMESARMRKRINDLLQKHALDDATFFRPPGAVGTESDPPRDLRLRFFLKPTALLPDAECPDSVGAVRFEVTQLEGESGHQKAVGTGVFEDIPCGLVLRSIGYRSVPLPGLPFDHDRAVVRQQAGRVEGVPALYCAGWIKRGPTGIIGTNVDDARETVQSILEDAQRGVFHNSDLVGALQAAQEAMEPSAGTAIEGTGDSEGGAAGDGQEAQTPQEPPRRRGMKGVLEYFRDLGRPEHTMVHWSGFELIDEAETEAGRQAGKPREKITSVLSLLRTACGAEKQKE